MTVYRVITYAPGRASFPKPRSKATFQSHVPKLRSKAMFQSHVPKPRSKATLPPGGILTLVSSQCRPSKISVESIRIPEPVSPQSQSQSQYPPEFPSRLQGDTLRAMVPLLSFRVSVSSHASASRPEFPRPACRESTLRAMFLVS